MEKLITAHQARDSIFAKHPKIYDFLDEMLSETNEMITSSIQYNLTSLVLAIDSPSSGMSCTFLELCNKYNVPKKAATLAFKSELKERGYNLSTKRDYLLTISWDV